MIRRLGGVGFAVLVVATVAAFFITQHLKVSDPLIAGARVVPTDINPQGGRVCLLAGKPTNYRHSSISFFLPDHSDTVGVLIVNAAGERVRTIAWRHLNVGQRGNFTWNGRESSGRLAPDGTYYVQIALQNEGRSFDLSGKPISVIRTMPQVTLNPVRVVAASGSGHGTTTTGGAAGAAGSGSAGGTAAAGPGAPVLTPGKGLLEIGFHTRPTRGGTVLVYRTSAAGEKRLVDSYPIPAGLQHATWDGKIHGTPAPAGTYAIGVEVKDKACNVGSFPAKGQRSSRATAGAGVTVSYVSATAPLTPVATGGQAKVSVTAPDTGGSYGWTLRRAGSSRTVAGAASSSSSQLQTELPGSGPGLYVLGVHAGGDEASLPLVAAGNRAPVLIVLPTLTWQGENAIDETGNGFPDTLVGGQEIELERPLVGGLPAGFTDVADLLRYLRQKHMRFQLTTDIALAQGIGPQLSGHRGVLMLGSFRWLPTSLTGRLHAYVEDGGHLATLGAGSLLGRARLHFTGGAAGTGTASPVATAKLDPFGIGHTADQPTSVNIELGHGTVVETAIGGLGQLAGGMRSARNLVGSLWQLLKS